MSAQPDEFAALDAARAQLAAPLAALPHTGQRAATWEGPHRQADPLAFLNRQDFQTANPPLTLVSATRVGAQRTRWAITVRAGADEHQVQLGKHGRSRGVRGT